MMILVGDSRVYWFDGSTIICDIYDGYAEILVLPERPGLERRFLMRLGQDQRERLQQAYPERTLQHILATIIANALRDGLLQVDEEVSA